MSKDQTRLSININEDCAEALREVRAYYRISYTETVRRAISIYKFIFDELRMGNDVCIRDHSGAYSKITFIEES